MTHRNIAPLRLVVLFMLSLLAATVAQAASLDEDEPIRVDARSVEANDKTGAVVYSGNVVVEQGRLSIQADRIEVITRKGKTELVRATGKPAKLRQRAETANAEIRAEADRVDYHVSLKNVDLIGHVSLRRGDDLFTADVLHYDLNTKSLNAAGGDKGEGRVHAVIQPKQTADGPAPGP
ncbi:sugar transporter [Sulfuricaulis limicola]|uniref:Lipopolysaccharide export system protein LptA n=1 Tax=Sulfuricaulis limicola TaxID=1620215 RepID=A0A1B4XI66_9GAMM|nr:lipopolysaccharide transport periplasmic protein LptA [Sulfuricaulis limicola]BAV34501.1 sugar transporter [Sulfuricaulis limicola]